MKKNIIIVILGFVVFLFPGASKASGCMEYGIMAMEDYLRPGYCKCMTGYVWGTDFLGKPYCVSGNSLCEKEFGLNSKANYSGDKCECKYGYIWGKDIIGRTS
jgi:hypothetical protein